MAAKRKSNHVSKSIWVSVKAKEQKIWRAVHSTRKILADSTAFDCCLTYYSSTTTTTPKNPISWISVSMGNLFTDPLQMPKLKDNYICKAAHLFFLEATRRVTWKAFWGPGRQCKILPGLRRSLENFQKAFLVFSQKQEVSFGSLLQASSCHILEVQW